MPAYGLPGVAMDEKRSLAMGAIALAVVVTAALIATVVAGVRADSRLRVSLLTEQIGDGIEVGTEVRLDGVRVGTVSTIEPGDGGTQRIALRLDRSRLFGIDDSLRLDYAPANLFGISELELKRGSGGAPLRDDAFIDLTGPRAKDVYDATMGSLLRTLSQVGDSVLTPRVAAMLSRMTTDLDAFTPLLQAMVVTAGTVADKQTMPISTVLGNFGTTLDSGAGFVDATVRLLQRIYSIPVLRTDRQLFDSGVNVVVEDVLPAIRAIGDAARDQLSGYTDMLIPLLRALAQMVPAPTRSGEDVSALLDRLRTAMPDTPNGPVLDLSVDLRGVPALAVPLLGLSAPAGAGR